MDQQAVLDAMRALVARVVGPGRTPPADLSADTPLAESGLWLDSVEMLELIIACETEFAITFAPGTDLLGDNLETLGTLAALVHAKSPRLSRV
jgi:acyl carrier protein